MKKLKEKRFFSKTSNLSKNSSPINLHNDVQNLLDELFRKVEIVNSTTDITVYFSNYADCFSLVQQLLPYENNSVIAFSGDSPSTMLRVLNEKRPASLHDFLERSAKSRAVIHGDDPSFVKQTAYESFCKDLEPYISNFDTENRLFLMDQCKSIFNSSDTDFSTTRIDPIIDESIDVITFAQAASTTLLQRKLRLGYGRAARIIDTLERIGIVGPADGAKPRKVLVSYEDYIKNKSLYLYRLNKLSTNDLERTNEELKDRLGSHPFSFDNMNGYEFENFCCKLLIDNHYKNVKQTKLSGDEGIDIIAEKEEIKYGIQCKCYSSPVGIKAVQEAFTGAKMYDCDIAVVITNNCFTSQAIHAAEQTRVRLWDRNKLNEMINN